MDKSSKEEREQRIFDMWLSCHTQEEIAEAEDMAQQTVADRVSKFTDLGQVSKSGKTHAEYADDTAPPIYNVWTANAARWRQRMPA